MGFDTAESPSQLHVWMPWGASGHTTSCGGVSQVSRSHRCKNTQPRVTDDHNPQPVSLSETKTTAARKTDPCNHPYVNPYLASTDRSTMPLVL